ncbi:2OG-Fe(II) oxygenase [Dyadobacter sp. CY107]|uniref:2OG-Fe(II) oxygenase n=1 Tax=Dyadobacter fanqingshengii TaxID=2906443 RepID=UPI001F3B2EB2|nr:2OG-Fe(II) oxygenase [Dyadobacter fanqingshengii]MCF2504848.1 2OG-Fe(II) oxygenase [Dyadobacter fanqingshengii]
MINLSDAVLQQIAVYSPEPEIAGSINAPCLQTVFNELIDSYIENKVGIAENFLDASLASSLKANLMSLLATNQLLPAGTGNDSAVVHNKLYRNDSIYWLDRKHNDPHENEFFDLMDQFVKHLNRTCYTGITGYEFHYALYPTGSFYKKHFDQFRNDSSRQYSMIMYLNTDWAPEDGGELRIHTLDYQQDIAPTNGKSVFFKSSELEHEVLLTNRPRMSVTGWLKVG